MGEGWRIGPGAAPAASKQGRLPPRSAPQRCARARTRGVGVINTEMIRSSISSSNEDLTSRLTHMPIDHSRKWLVEASSSPPSEMGRSRSYQIWLASRHQVGPYPLRELGRVLLHRATEWAH